MNDIININDAKINITEDEYIKGSNYFSIVIGEFIAKKRITKI